MRVRTFLALPLSSEQREQLLRLQKRLARSLTDVKWVAADNLHVTLLFLGEVDGREVPRACVLAQTAARAFEPFECEVAGLGCFPHPRRPRVLWAGITTGGDTMVSLHDQLEIPFAELGYRREERSYTPHITLGRTKSDGPLASLTAMLSEHEGWSAGSQRITELHILSSELTRQGPIYRIMGRAYLGTRGANNGERM